MGKKKVKPPKQLVSSVDKAEWHMRAVQRAGLAPIQAFVPGGLLLGWLVQNKMVNDLVELHFKDSVVRFRNRELTAAHLFEVVGGVLNITLTNEIGTPFLKWYETKYMKDYERTLLAGVPDNEAYAVTDCWENYEKFAKVLDERLLEFQESQKSTT